MKIECICKYCKKEFKRQKANVRVSHNTFCSRDCYNKASKGIFKGKRKQRKLLLFLTCSYCNSPVEKWNYTLKSSLIHFCNNKCKGKWMSLHLIAEKSVNWKGGLYSTIANTLCNSRYRRIREIVLVLDNYKCQLCGSNIRLEIHHIIEKGKNPTLIFDITNMITLCKKCHCNIRGNEEDYIGYFNDIVAKRANSVESRTGNTELNGNKTPKCVETIYPLRKE